MFDLGNVAKLLHLPHQLCKSASKVARERGVTRSAAPTAD